MTSAGKVAIYTGVREHVWAYVHTDAHAYTHKCIFTHIYTQKNSLNLKRNAKYISLQRFLESSKACSSDPLDGWFVKATTREAYRGSRPPSFP